MPFLAEGGGEGWERHHRGGVRKGDARGPGRSVAARVCWLRCCPSARAVESAAFNDLGEGSSILKAAWRRGAVD